MRRIDVEKKRTTPWPWLLGAVLLALVVWGATILLRPPAKPEAPDLPPTAADTLPPSAIPSATGGATAEREAQRLGDLVPLDEEDVGATVEVEGEVVATGNAAYWILSESRVLRIDSPHRARRGDTLAVRGVIETAEEALTDQMATDVLSRHPESEAWTIVRSFKVIAEEPAPELPNDSA